MVRCWAHKLNSFVILSLIRSIYIVLLYSLISGVSPIWEEMVSARNLVESLAVMLFSDVVEVPHDSMKKVSCQRKAISRQNHRTKAQPTHGQKCTMLLFYSYPR